MDWWVIARDSFAGRRRLEWLEARSCGRIARTEAQRGAGDMGEASGHSNRNRGLNGPEHRG